jgi:exopolysaccharide biosynthesis predicted pyruvyltransferase EpsI
MAGMDSFLNSRLINNSEKSNYLSKNLRTSVEVIREAQRIHYNMFNDSIGRFKFCILLDTADFENKGDPAITLGEMLFIARLGLKLVYYCSTAACHRDQFSTAYSVASKYSPNELVILLHGGGNVNIYSFHEKLRAMAFNKFQGYQFFMFPQSIFLKDSNTALFQNCIKLYCCNENLTFVQRDYRSYEIAQKYFKGVSKLLVAPDMAFHIGPVTRIMLPVFDILWIKRKDEETPGYLNIPDYPPHLRVHVSDWLDFVSPKAGTSWEKSIYSVVMGLFYTQRGRVIVTDRLHGHILATLLDIPHVLLDNTQRKLSSYHNSWTKGLENTRITNKPEEAMRLALELLEIYGDILPPRAPWLDISDSMQKINFTLPNQGFA